MIAATFPESFCLVAPTATIDYQHLLTAENLMPFLRVLILLFVAVPTVLFVSKGIRRFLKGRVSPQHAMLASKCISYVFVGILLVMILRELGFKLTTLLGAAGIFGVAIGFAAQTSLSNLISGIFLIWEKTFEIGDMVKVGTTTGVVTSIDILSIKLRTIDNQLIRIPNQTLVMSEMANLTAFGIRRLDIPFGVAYGTDLQKMIDVLKSIAADLPHVLDEPRPVVSLTKFGDSSVDVLFGVWVDTVRMVEMRNACIMDIHTRFAEEGIEIPFPIRTIHMVEAHHDGPQEKPTP